MNQKMPVLFVGHGSPINAIEENPHSLAWREMGRSLPTPQAILCVSAHWETHGTRVTGEEHPRMIYDFSGFPRELYQVIYPAPGSPSLAQQVQGLLPNAVRPDLTWGLDHGAWSVLVHLFPSAVVPVVQLSLNRALAPEEHYKLARELRPLRDQGVMLIASGNMVHNLRLIRMSDTPYDWATEFDQLCQGWIESGDHESLIHYERAGKAAALSIPTNEHYLPLLYALALRDPEEPAQFFAEGTALSSLSMRSVRFG
jgi:4,5-DOPA dioxygenase extradiol